MVEYIGSESWKTFIISDEHDSLKGGDNTQLRDFDPKGKYPERYFGRNFPKITDEKEIKRIRLENVLEQLEFEKDANIYVDHLTAPMNIGVSNFLYHDTINNTIIIYLGEHHRQARDFPDIISRNTYRTKLIMECHRKFLEQQKMSLEEGVDSKTKEYISLALSMRADNWRGVFWNVWYRMHPEDIMPVSIASKIEKPTNPKDETDYIVVDGIKYYYPPNNKLVYLRDDFEIVACDFRNQVMASPIMRNSKDIDECLEYLSNVSDNPKALLKQMLDTDKSKLNQYELFNFGTLYRFVNDIHYWVKEYFTRSGASKDICKYDVFVDLFTCNELLKYVFANKNICDPQVAILYHGLGHIPCYLEFVRKIHPAKIDCHYKGESEYVVVFIHGFGTMGRKYHELGMRELRELCKEHKISHMLYYRTMFESNDEFLDTFDLEYEYFTMLSFIRETYKEDKKLILVGHSYGGLVAAYFRQMDKKYKHNRIIRTISLDGSDFYICHPFFLYDEGLIPKNYDATKLKYTRDSISYDGNEIEIVPKVWPDIGFYHAAYDTKDDYENRFIVDYVEGNPKYEINHIDDQHYKNYYEIKAAIAYI